MIEHDPYADIRPYRDDEVAPVLARLLDDPELTGAIAAFRFGGLSRLLPFLLRPAVRWYLKRELRGVETIHDLQLVIRGYMEAMIENTTAGLTVSGLDQLDPACPYLFVSNHRDIALDPAFTNYALHVNGFDTVQIAIGDNLLTKPWVSDLMRLNKSFIVRRSAAGPRQLLAASRHLSAYIRHAITEQHANVWIAQREGRAKDGIDRTEPAVIKMLSLSRDKASEDFGEHIASLGIVPVAISYEVDPCDALKARELAERARTGAYEKGEQEDVASIGVGIAGSKGRVHVSFGSPLGGGFGSAAAVAAEIDRQVLAGFRLHATNLQAFEALEGRPAPAGLVCEGGSVSAAAFRARMEAIPAEHRPYALAIYANAVRSQLAALGEAA
ncbi:MAG: 1-acyl-sn-glycerol-3-phosphate acyltransferase [Pseudohaliea sp.]